MKPQSLDFLKSELSLPPCWVDQSTVGLCKLEARQDNSSEVTRCITIQPDFTWKMYVHGKEISHSCSAITGISEKLDPTSLQKLILILDKCKICCGNPEQQFVSLVESRNGSIKRHNGVVSAYLDKSLSLPLLTGDDVSSSATVRSSRCDLISSTSKCVSCASYRKNLRALVSSSKISSPKKKKRLDTSSHTNYRYLHTPELRERLHNSRIENKTLSRKIEQLRKKIYKLTQAAGVTLDDHLNSDMQV